MNQTRAAELIAMLTAKICRFEPTIATFGALDRYDVVHAMALVKNLPAQMLIRIKYAGEESNTETFQDQFCSAIERGALSHVEQFAAPERWKAPRPGFLRDMCRLAVVECLAPNLCWGCAGHGGSLDQEGKYHVCSQCGGLQFKYPTERKRARILGIDESAFKKSWSPRYRVIQNLLDKYESIGLGGTAKRLSG